MRWIPDRFWWVQRYGRLVFAAGCLVMTIYAEIQAYGSYQLAAQLPDAPITEDLRNGALMLALIGLVFAFPAVVSVDFFVRGSFRARERYQRRLRAMQGEQKAMPRAAVPVQPHHAPDLASEPLELLWRATPSRSRTMTILLAIMLVIFAPIDGFFWYLAYCLATNTPPFGSASVESLSLLARVGVVGVAVFVALLPLFLVVFLVSRFPVERGRPYGVTASSEGLWYYPQVGKRRLLRWDEVGLLEVYLPKNERYRAYRLYGRDAIAWWLELPPSKWVSLGMTTQEFEQRHQALLDLIVARTHLLPRTLDRKLAEASGV